MFHSDLGSWPVEDCLLQTARYLVFPPPRGAGRAQFAYPFVFNEAGRRLSSVVGVAWGYETIRSRARDIRGCRDSHGFRGPFHLTIYVGRLGRVLSAGFAAHEATKDTFPACLLEKIEQLRFPNPGPRIVKYRMLVEDLRHDG